MNTETDPDFPYEQLAEDAKFMDQLKNESTEEVELLLEEEKAMEHMGDKFEENKVYQAKVEARKPKLLSIEELYTREYPDQEWIIDKFLPKEGFSMIVGEAGSFKSFFTLYLTKCLITGESVLGTYEVKKKVKVLYIDKENRLRRVKLRLQGLGMPSNTDLFFLEAPEHFSLEDTAYLDQLKAIIVENDIELIVVDSFIDVFIGKENDSTDTSKTFDLIRQIAPTATFLLLHHDSKPLPNTTRTALQRTRGSGNIAAQLETQYYFSKTSEHNVFTIENGKSRDEMPLPKFSVSVQYEENGPVTGFSYKGAFLSEVKLTERAEEALYNAIVSHPMIKGEELFLLVENDTGIEHRTLRDGLKLLKVKELITATKKPGHGNNLFWFATAKQTSIPLEGGDEDEFENS